MPKRALLCYAVDLFLFLVGLASALSGFVLMAGGEGGYRGGRNAASSETLVGTSRHTWTTLHEVSSIALVAGVVVHVLLHWRWLVRVTLALFKAKAPSVSVCPPESEQNSLGRRE